MMKGPKEAMKTAITAFASERKLGAIMPPCGDMQKARRR
jgi:hypothetical protein